MCVLRLSLQASLKLTALSALTEEYFWTVPPPSPLSLSPPPFPSYSPINPLDAGIESMGTVLSTEAERTEPGGAAMEAEAEGRARV